MTKNYLQEFGEPVSKFQMGGAPGGPAPEQGGDAGMQEALMQVVQYQDPAMALEFCNMLAQEMGMTGGAPQGAPMPAPQGAPMPAARQGMKVPGYVKSGKPLFNKTGQLIG